MDESVLLNIILEEEVAETGFDIADVSYLHIASIWSLGAENKRLSRLSFLSNTDTKTIAPSNESIKLGFSMSTLLISY